MKCPVCSIDLNMMERQGVEIDYCPKCRGIWLDRGELDKIIERESAQSYSRPEQYGRPEQHGHEHHDDYNKPGEHHWSKDHKRQGFLGRMLDFD